MSEDFYTQARRELTIYWDANHDHLVTSDNGISAGGLRDRNPLGYEILSQAWNTIRSVSLFNHIPSTRREEARVEYWKKNGREHCLSLLGSFEKGFAADE